MKSLTLASAFFISVTASAGEISLQALKITNENGKVCEISEGVETCQEQTIPELKLVENGEPNIVFTQLVQDIDTKEALKSYHHIFIREFIFHPEKARIGVTETQTPYVVAIKWQRRIPGTNQPDPLRQGTIYARGSLTVWSRPEDLQTDGKGPVGTSTFFNAYTDSQPLEKYARILNFGGLDAQFGWDEEVLENETMRFLREAVAPTIAGYTSALFNAVFRALASRQNDPSAVSQP